MNELKCQLNKLLVGEELNNCLSFMPEVKENFISKEDRLLALLDIYKIYIPNSTSFEIYNNLYLAVVNSLEKKETIEEVKLINDSYFSRKKYGIIGGLDSFKITGLPGVGKTATIHRCIDIIGGGRLLKCSKSKRYIIAFLVVECPADGSFKSLLYSILQQIDFQLNTSYFNCNSGRYITTDYLLNVVSVILINHVGVLIIDEIERVASNTAKGSTLINYLTQLVNQTNVGICFVGNESSNSYFSIKEYLSRRTVGISVKHLNYDEFNCFSDILFKYQYTVEKIQFNSDISQALFKLSNGIPALIMGLFIEAQKYAILNDIASISSVILERVFNALFGNMSPHLVEKDNKKAIDKVKEAEIDINVDKEIKETLISDIYKVAKKDLSLFLSMVSKKIVVERVNDIS